MILSFGITFAARAGKIVDFPEPVGALIIKNLQALSLFKNSFRTDHAGSGSGLSNDTSCGVVVTRDGSK